MLRKFIDAAEADDERKAKQLLGKVKIDGSVPVSEISLTLRSIGFRCRLADGRVLHLRIETLTFFGFNPTGRLDCLAWRDKKRPC